MQEKCASEAKIFLVGRATANPKTKRDPSTPTRARQNAAGKNKARVSAQDDGLVALGFKARRRGGRGCRAEIEEGD
jgi:hypothetical protein